MDVIYLLTLNGKEHRAEIETVRSGRYRVTLDGKSFVVSARRPETAIYSLLIGPTGEDEFAGGKVVEADVTFEADHDQVTVGVRGEQFAVTAIDERRKNLRTAAGTTAASDGSLRSPMPGKVVKILVAKGAKVTRGQGLVVVEAMKMENELAAPRDGVVKEISVSEGQPVDGGALLLTLE